MHTKKISWILRIVVAALFIVSALAKLYPSPYFAISTFEVKQLYPLGFSEHLASYFSRTLIGIEFALGFLLLIPHYLKKITIPATVGLLLTFIIHLSYETYISGNTGNCGCFGELIPMKPIEAIIKNIIAVGLLIWLWKISENDKKSNIWILSTIKLACILVIFMLAPIKSISASNDSSEALNISIDSIQTVSDSTKTTTTEVEITQKDTIKSTVKNTTEAGKNEMGPKPTKSGYAEYFSDIDKGRKIFCFFVPGCEHCRHAAKELYALQKKYKDFPEVRIIFMDEEAEKIPDFFAFAGTKFPYKVIDIIPFWTKLGAGKDTPGVVYLWNGNVIKFYDGIAEKAFNKREFEKITTQAYKK
jgi:thiol-disulfide isomerase/thioredoxin/uncharacterized membrane protein YphA (DoxX/SURF4 family)